jgi:hypothetical protein
MDQRRGLGHSDPGGLLAAAASVALIASFFLPWYVLTGNPPPTYRVTGPTDSVTAFHAGGGRFFVLGFAGAMLLTCFLRGRLRPLAFVVFLGLSYAVLICFGNSPTLGVAGLSAVYSHGVGAEVGLGSAIAAGIGALIHVFYRRSIYQP